MSMVLRFGCRRTASIHGNPFPIRAASSLLWLVLAVSGFGQKPALRVYSVDDGLKYSQVFTITQDSRGCIWIGTSYGVARFNGSRVLNLTSIDGLPHDSVHEIVEDAQGKLWVMTQLGPSRLDPDRMTTSRQCFLPVPAALEGVHDLHAVRDADSLWFIQYNERKLFHLQAQRVEFVPLPDLTRDDRIRGIRALADTLYLCTKGQVAAYHGGGWRIMPVAGKQKGENINLVEFGGRLYLLTKTALFKLEDDVFREDNTWALPDPDSFQIFDLLSFGESLVALSYSRGFFLIDKSGGRLHFTTRNGLPTNSLNHGFIDRDGMLWLGTENGAVKVFDFSILSYGRPSGICSRQTWNWKQWPVQMV